MTETIVSPSHAEQAQTRAQLMVHEQRQGATEISPIDTVEDMLELAESAHIARNMLAQRYHEVHPEPDNLAPEQTERLINHAHFLKEVGSISTQDWQQIGISKESTKSENINIPALIKQLNSGDAKKVSSITSLLCIEK